MLLNSWQEASSTLMPKLGGDVTQEQAIDNFPDEHRFKNPQ